MLVVPDGVKPPPPPSPCDTVIVAVPDKEATVAGRKRLFYRTLPQDGLRDIAAFFKVKPSVGRGRQWNHLDLDARLASNMVLQLWVEPGFDEAKAALVDAVRVRLVTTGSDEFFDLVEAKRGRARLTYTVKKGDDLKRIGKKFGLKPADLERINRFGEHYAALHVGQKITVYRELSKAEKDKAACKIVPTRLPVPSVAMAPEKLAVPVEKLAASLGKAGRSCPRKTAPRAARSRRRRRATHSTAPSRRPPTASPARMSPANANVNANANANVNA